MEGGMNNGAGGGAPLLYNLHDAIQMVRKYNGRTDANEWVERFRADLAAFGITYRWALYSLDRFFTEDAGHWWASVSPNHENQIRLADADEDHFINCFDVIAQELSEFFDHSSMKLVYKQKNKKVVFKMGDDPQEYVAKKLAILKEVDRTMTERKKVENLRRGLPVDLQYQLTNLGTVSEFMEKLRVFSEIFQENRSKASTSSHTSSDEKSYALHTQGISQNEAVKSFQNAHTSQQRGGGAGGGRPLTCFQCNKPGHMKRDCPEGQNVSQFNGQTRGGRGFNSNNGRGQAFYNRGQAHNNFGRGQGRGAFNFPHFPQGYPYYNPYMMPFMGYPPFILPNQMGSMNNYPPHYGQQSFQSPYQGNRQAQNMHQLGIADKESSSPQVDEQGNE